ncbi:MAG: hypothetical protein Q9199_006966 [Rusavskia elegans]
MADVKLPVRTVPRKPRLDTLPQEVHDLIFEHASSPQTRLKHHLWPLLFVSRQMYQAVLPSMYRRVSFQVDSSVGSYEANYQLLQLADKENQGLMHIEEVRLYPRDELRRMPSVDAEYPDAIQLLAAVPKNQLRRFNWDSWHTMPQEVLRLLWKRQHRLTNIEMVPCTKPVDELIDELGLGDKSFHEHATELRIADVGRGTTPAAALRVLKERRSQINTLTLDFRSIKDSIEVIAHERSIDDDPQLRRPKMAYLESLRNASRENLLKELFRPSKQYQPALPLALVTLHLHSVDLWYGPRYLLTGLELKLLRNLHIISCQRPDVLLEGMSELSAEKRPRLDQFHIYHEQQPWEFMWVSDDIRTDRTSYYVNEFLLSMKDTLVDLWIVMRGLHAGEGNLLSPMAIGIANHGNSLLQLTADVRTFKPLHSAASGEQHVGWFDLETWERLCASMAQLQQLYVPFPPVVADENISARDEFVFYLDTALQIPTLKTLNMTTWPYPLYTILHRPGDSRPFDPAPYIVRPWKTKQFKKGTYLPVHFYHHCLKYIADYIAQQRNDLVSSPCKPLDAVGFGLLERDHYMSNLRENMNPVYFFHGGRKYLEGETPNMEQWSYREISRTQACELLSGVVNIDWLIKKPIRERDWD